MEIKKDFIKRIAKNIILRISLCLFSVAGYSQTIQYYQTGEEFAGPFPSWKNVKSDFGAKGDGVTDDAPAIQNALDALKAMNSNTWAVLYFPAGTYRINSTLKTLRSAHTDYLGITIIGEDPATTILSWNGPSEQNMFSLDAWYSKVSRLTFDGKGTANTGLMRDGGFSTYCELNDLFFKDMKTGISLGGSSGNGQAEHAIERCRFTRCSDFGILTADFNSMDIYVWYCLFEDCGRGIYNWKGGYNAFENIFLRSKVADCSSDNNHSFNIVNNTSVDSKTFMAFNAGIAYIQGNKIYNTLDPLAIFVSNQYGGATSLIGNVIRNRSGNSGPCISAPGNRLTVDNTFTVSNPLGTGGRNFVIKQSIVNSSTIPVPSILQLPGTPQNKNRKIFEVNLGTGNDASEIQQKINAAANEPVGTNPIVHIPKGNFSIKTTVIIPSKELQVVGDGGNESGTVIKWSGTGTGPGFKLSGPSRVTMRDISMFFGGNTDADLITIENSDQVGGRIFCDQVVVSGNSSSSRCNTSFLIDGVENSDVTFINGGWGEYTTAGVLVKGGPTLAAGGSTNGQVSLLLGALGNNENKIIDVQNGGRVLACGYRDETPIAGTILNLSPTTGAVSIMGMSWAATPSTTVPFINVNGFKGTLAYIGNTTVKGYAQDSGSFFMNISGDGSNCNVLSAASYFTSQNSTTSAAVWKDNSSPKAKAALLNCFGGDVNQTIINIPNVVNKVPNAGVDTAFVLTTLSQIRNLRIEPPINRPNGVTDVKLIRMLLRVADNRMGLTLKSGVVTGIKESKEFENSAVIYPNPASQYATFDYKLAENSQVKIAVYDLLGKETMLLIDETQSEGEHLLKINTANFQNGIYFVKMNVSEMQFVQKLIINK
ncbi:MAG: T9SS type A sorting domain-containing protein [Bacteroidetes bacterium]|nr:T9SS type A sorting domain-containing protein [Bacteroidota bacterium]